MIKHISTNSLLRAAELLEEFNNNHAEFYSNAVWSLAHNTEGHVDWIRRMRTWYEQVKQDEQRIRNEEY